MTDATMIDVTMIDRRGFSLAAATLALVPGALARSRMPGPEARLAAIERAAGGRFGAFVLDTGNGRQFGHRAGERFAMCSTFKLSLAALVLREADAGRLPLDEQLPYARTDLLPNSPRTGARLGNKDRAAMAIVELAEAAQTTSDNLAANLLLHRLGGPAALTGFWRGLGDRESRLDRFETELNAVPAGDPRDTTTPRAIAQSVARFATGAVLTQTSRTRLLDWMARTGTGGKRIRAALPAGWRGGDKTGTGNPETMPSHINDIAVITPPGRAPLVVAGFYEPAGLIKAVLPAHEAVLRQLGEVAADWAIG